MLIPAIAIIALAAALTRPGDPRLTSKNRRIDELVLSIFGVKPPTQNRLDKRFVDADGDMLADAPEDRQAWNDPDPVVFTYIATREPEFEEDTWQPLLGHLQERLGRPVVYRHYQTIEEQLNALSAGELHVCGLNTGSVPLAVNAYGFVPICTYGQADGSFGYRMQIVVPEKSKIRALADIGSDTVFAFTHPTSNSGFKAPLVLLMTEYGKQPERDYPWAMAGSHEEALKGVSSGVYDAAAVASDMFSRSVASGEVKDGQLRVVYESERYPSAAIGCLNNLEPELAERLRQALLEYSFAGSEMAALLGAPESERFVPVTYKDDWALIRRNDDALGVVHTAPSM